MKTPKIVTYGNGRTNLSYDLTEQGCWWAQKIGSTGRVLLADCDARPWNHHNRKFVTDKRLLDLARRLGVVVDFQRQESINEAHAIFVNNRGLGPNWYHLNEALHAAEDAIQQRGRSTTIDCNSATNMRTKHPIPEWWSSSDQPVSGIGLFAQFTLIGRWWSEIYRARDWVCPQNQHATQKHFSPGVVMRFDEHTVEDCTNKDAEGKYRAMYGGTPRIPWEDVQHGLYHIGVIRQPVDLEQWFSEPISWFEIS